MLPVPRTYAYISLRSFAREPVDRGVVHLGEGLTGCRCRRFPLGGFPVKYEEGAMCLNFGTLAGSVRIEAELSGSADGDMMDERWKCFVRGGSNEKGTRRAGRV